MEDIERPDFLCIHVSSNDIGSGRKVETIEENLEYLIKLVKEQNVQPIMSLVIQRNDNNRYSYLVDEVNRRIIQLCEKYNVGYIDHSNITTEHLNAGGVHISNHYNYLLLKNMSSCFNYVVKHYV